MHEPPPEPITLKTPTSLRAKAKATMQQHGCIVEDGSVTLPPGSTRTLCERYLQTSTQWYDIVLPDQFRILEAYEPQRHLSILYLQTP